MNRRKYLAALGVLGSGTAAAMGTGAFTSASASRDVSVSVADDTNGYLGFGSSQSANGEFASVSGDEIALDFDTSDGGGSGVGLNSTYNFDDVFTIENQGTQTIYVWANFSGEDLDDDDIWFYPGSDSGRRLNDGPNSVVTLTTGQQVNVGVHIDTSVLSSTDDQALTATLNADVDVPGGKDGSQPSDPVGEDAAVVSKNPDDGEYSSIQSAINAVDGTTVLVESGRYEESVTIDVDGLTLKGPNAGIDGDSGSRGAEATIDGKVNIGSGGNPGPDPTLSGEVVIDGIEMATTTNGVSDGVVSVADRDERVENATIKNSVIDIDTSTAGIGIASEEVDNLTIENNAFTSSGSGTSVAYNAVQSPINTIEISENTLTDVDRLYNEAEGGAFIDGRGIDSTTVRIVDNDVNGANFAIGTGIVDDDLTTVDYVIRGNQIEASSVGISQGSGTPASFTIENNDFTGDSGTTYVDDAANEILDLDAILNDQGNTFDPTGEVDGNRIVPKDEEGGEE